MEVSSPERQIRRMLASLNQTDPVAIQKGLESVEQYLKSEKFFLTAINSPEFLDLIVCIFVTSITKMADISSTMTSLSASPPSSPSSISLRKKHS